MEIKEQKLKEICDDGNAADYAELTVTDDDYAEEEKDRFQSFLR